MLEDAGLIPLRSAQCFRPVQGQCCQLGIFQHFQLRGSEDGHLRRRQAGQLRGRQLSDLLNVELAEQLASSAGNSVVIDRGDVRAIECNYLSNT